MKYNNSNNNTGIAAVILSAGYSSRMKRFKPLLPVGETTAVQKLVRSVKDAGIGRIVTVTGYSRELLRPVLDMRAVSRHIMQTMTRACFRR